MIAGDETVTLGRFLYRMVSSLYHVSGGATHSHMLSSLKRICASLYNRTWWLLVDKSFSNTAARPICHMKTSL